MTQFFVFGSSSAYGVGGENGGWADKLKQRLHQKMYGPHGVGELHELHNFALPGATVDFVQETYEAQLGAYCRKKERAVALLAIGGNDAKAEDEPDHFLCTPEAFEEKMELLMRSIGQRVAALYVLGFPAYDETKTMPQSAPFSGRKSFFSNVRRLQFNMKIEFLCQNLGATYVSFPVEDQAWINSCAFTDGLHPNDKGHEVMAELLWGYFLSSV